MGVGILQPPRVKQENRENCERQRQRREGTGQKAKQGQLLSMDWELNGDIPQLWHSQPSFGQQPPEAGSAPSSWPCSSSSKPELQGTQQLLALLTAGRGRVSTMQIISHAMGTCPQPGHSRAGACAGEQEPLTLAEGLVSSGLSCLATADLPLKLCFLWEWESLLWCAPRGESREQPSG